MYFLLIAFITATCFFNTGNSDRLSWMRTKISEARDVEVNNQIVNIEHLHKNHVNAIMHMNEDIFRKQFKDVTKYNASTYMLSYMVGELELSTLACAAHGGYPVEINDDGEWNAMKDFLSRNAVRTAYIGIDDFVKDGQFVYSFSGTPAFKKFGPGLPQHGEGAGGVVLSQRIGYLMEDCNSATWHHHICEIPVVN